MKTDIESFADGLSVVAAIIRMEHEDCPDCGDWLDVAAFLEDVAAVPEGELCEPRRERALRVVRLVMDREPAAVSA